MKLDRRLRRKWFVEHFSGKSSPIGLSVDPKPKKILVDKSGELTKPVRVYGVFRASRIFLYH